MFSIVTSFTRLAMPGGRGWAQEFPFPFAASRKLAGTALNFPFALALAIKIALFLFRVLGPVDVCARSQALMVMDGTRLAGAQVRGAAPWRELWWKWVAVRLRRHIAHV